MAASRHIAVIGAGNGGLAVAAWTGVHGWQVRIHDIDAATVEGLRAAGVVEVAGVISGTAPLECVTGDVSEAIAGADLVVVVVPAWAQGQVATELAPHLSDEQIVLVMPGCTGGALAVSEVLAANGRRRQVLECDAFPFACTRPSPNRSEIAAVKAAFGIAAVPAAVAQETVATVIDAFPQAQVLPSVLHSGLTNINPVMHVGPMLLNAGRIEHTNGDFAFYAEGLTPAAVRVVMAYDAERLAVADALGVRVPSLADWLASAYGLSTGELPARLEGLKRVLGSAKAPPAMRHRYLTEDVPFGTVPVASLARELGVAAGTHEALIELASIALGEELWATGRTATTLGLAGLDAEGMRRRVGAPP